MNFYEALFEVVKTDYHVSMDDPWYCCNQDAIARIESVLQKIEYKPYLDWREDLRLEAEREKKEQEEREAARKRTVSPNLVHALDSHIFESMSPNEIDKLMI